MSEPKERAYSVGLRLLRILESFAEEPIQSLSEVAERTELDTTTAHRYLKQLFEQGWLERDPNTLKYRPSTFVIRFGHRAAAARPIRLVARPYMERLQKEFGETVNLAVRQDDDLVIIDAVESPRSVRRGAEIGERDDWFNSSLGKAILAYALEPELDRMLSVREVKRATTNSITETGAIREELQRVRTLGYAVDDEEAEIGLRCVGVALFDSDAIPVAALSISGPADRLTPDLVEKIGNELLQASKEISVRLPSEG